MLFPTPEYAALFLLAFVAAWTSRSRPQLHKSLLLGLSWLFYAWAFPWHLPLLVGVSLWATWVARRAHAATEAKARRRWLVAGSVGALSVLIVFKYAGFLVSNFADLLHAAGWRGDLPIPDIVLPIGVSFFVFHAISLIGDAERGKLANGVSWLDGLLYVAFFPQQVAGPIVRAADFLPQLANGPDAAQIEASRGAALVLRGLFKKLVLAAHLGILVADPVFDAPESFGGPMVLLGILAYAGQIYCDFSGYTDMAIGSALLLGYRFPENFDAPYRATSLQDFWRRWHMSLSTFLRDYLYVALGGSRGGPWRTDRNLLLTMLLGGLWHGASWTFVVWGGLHGAGLVVHRRFAASPWMWVQHLRNSFAWQPVAAVLTFGTVCLGWVLFRSASLADAGRVLGRLTYAGPLPPPSLVCLVAAGICLQLLPTATWTQTVRWVARMPAALQGATAATAAVTIQALGPIGVPPFIYFQF